MLIGAEALLLLLRGQQLVLMLWLIVIWGM
jgi:hypothetical protein